MDLHTSQRKRPRIFYKEAKFFSEPCLQKWVDFKEAKFKIIKKYLKLAHLDRQIRSDSGDMMKIKNKIQILVAFET